MSDDATEENPFSFKHFVKTISKETLENPRDNEIEERSEVPVSINGQANGIIQLNTDIPFPEVDKTVQKRQVKGNCLFLPVLSTYHLDHSLITFIGQSGKAFVQPSVSELARMQSI